MESERYKLTVLFLKTFFRSWALSVKLNTQKETSSARRAPENDRLGRRAERPPERADELT